MYQPDKNPNESRWSYLKVAELIRQEILNGTYKAGKRLPGEPVLAKRFGVGRVTIARSLDVLEQSNLIFRVRGSGTYIQRDVARGTVRLVIGYLVYDVDSLRNSPSGIMLEASQKHLEDLGHTVRLLTHSELFPGGEPPATLRRMVRAGALNGLILSYGLYPDVALAINDVLPVMAVANDYLPHGMLNVAVDYTLGYFQATRHLLDFGHRKIGLLGGRSDRSIGYRAFQSFRLAMKLQGIDPDCQPVELCGFESADYQSHAEAMLREHPDMTGMVCIDDTAAEIAIAAACRMGRSVPGDFSVVGCNDMPGAATSDPPLTTLRIDFVQVGRLAVDLLLGRIFGRPSAATVYFEPQLVVRGSTAPARPPSV
jgi:DNA-binding LacI/PurR family transcriptional regulator